MRVRGHEAGAQQAPDGDGAGHLLISYALLDDEEGGAVAATGEAVKPAVSAAGVDEVVKH